MRFILMIAAAAAARSAPISQPPETPLSIAMSHQSLPEVQRALANGSSAREVIGKIPALMLAVAENRVDLAEALVGAGADVAAVTNESGITITPLHFAAFTGHLDMLTFLLSKGAPVDLPTNEGSTPLALVSTPVGFQASGAE